MADDDSAILAVIHIQISEVCGDGEKILGYSGDYNVIKKKSSSKRGRHGRGRYDKESPSCSDEITFRGT